MWVGLKKKNKAPNNENERDTNFVGACYFGHYLIEILMKKYFSYFLLFFLLFSCGGENVISNDELAKNAEKTAPWKNEPIVEINTDEDLKKALLFVDQLRDEFDKQIYNKKNKTETHNYEKNLTGEVNGNATYNLKSTYDDGQVSDEYYSTDTTDYIVSHGSFIFDGYENMAYSVHGKLKFKRSQWVGFGFGGYKETLDGGISYKDDLGVHVISIHLKKEVSSDYFSVEGANINAFNVVINGIEMSGTLPYNFVANSK